MAKTVWKKVGKTMRKVQILASGKWKFLKGKVRSPSSRKARHIKKIGGGIRKTMAKKKRKGGKSMIATAFKFIRLAALAANPVRIALMPGVPPQTKVTYALQDFTGYNIEDGSFDATRMVRGWGPFVMASLATYGIPKVTSIIRRL